MSEVRADDRGIVLACPTCRQKNRIGFSNLGDIGRCGKCSAELPALAEPVAVASERAFDRLVAEGSRPILVDFWAAWCGPCVMVAPEVAKVAAATAGRLTVVKVNTEELPTLSQRFHITSIPTMATFVDGREVGRILGARPAEGIRQFVDESLARAQPSR